MSENLMVGYTDPTTPPSSPLDTLKALVLRNIDRLDYVLDQLGGGSYTVPEDLIEFIDGIKLLQLQALSEHVPVAADELLGELRYIHADGRHYDDGSPVLERWEHQYGCTDYYPRYDGDRDEALERFNHWVGVNRAKAETETTFGEIIDGIDWGRNGPMDG